MTFKIYKKNGSGTVDRKYLDNPVEVESQYFEWAKVRTDDAGSISLKSDLPAVAPASYRIDRAWRTAREQEPERHNQIWATPETGFTGPTVFQIRGLAQMMDVSGLSMAKKLDVSARMWRYWVGSEARPIPYTAWHTMLSMAGFRR